MSDHFIAFRSSRFHYSCWGTGKQILFAFHGYGESAASFGFLAEALRRDFTIDEPALPFREATACKEKLFFDPADLIKLLGEIAASLPGREKGWWLLGYSMGGRVALQLLELAPERVQRLVMLAPDGLVANPWY